MKEQFGSLYSIRQLYEEGFKSIPKTIGIYMVVKPKDKPITFSANTTAIIEYDGCNLLYNADSLQTKFENSDKEILYVGKAGGRNNRLRQRIKQFVKYGYKEVNNHRGGRAIWQIESNEDLFIRYLECDNPEEKEKEILLAYINKYGILPVANWKIG